MKRIVYYTVYWFGRPVYQSTDELCADAYKNTLKGAIVKQSKIKVL